MKSFQFLRNRKKKSRSCYSAFSPRNDLPSPTPRQREPSALFGIGEELPGCDQIAMASVADFRRLGTAIANYIKVYRAGGQYEPTRLSSYKSASGHTARHTGG